MSCGRVGIGVCSSFFICSRKGTFMHLEVSRPSPSAGQIAFSMSCPKQNYSHGMPPLHSSCALAFPPYDESVNLKAGY